MAKDWDRNYVHSIDWRWLTTPLADGPGESWLKPTAELVKGETMTPLPVGAARGALRVIVEYQHSYPGLSMVDVEPEHVIPRLARVSPLMRQQFEALIPAPDAAVAAATVVRMAMSHYLVRSDDDDQFFAQLRHAAGLRNPPVTEL